MPEREHLEARIHTKVTKPNCDACDANAWRVSDEKHFVSIVGDDGTLRPGDGMPLYAVICTNCGFVRLYNALIL
jgi:hypothetical protein